MMQDKLSQLEVLVSLFSSNISQYKSQNYDEANLRVDFADKFFEVLDWDVRNIQGYAENYRDVVRESKIIISGKPKAPDYSFRIGGHRKFFVETKRPFVNIKEDSDSAFQIRRYGYTAKLPLSILTDFEEFAVYDTRIKPNQKDNSNIGRIFYCTFDEYNKHFDFIYNTFSKNAILKGSFDKYISDKKGKKGTSEVDKEFLKTIEDWRTELAKNIAKNNLKLNIEEINFAVQKIINRIIFLRIAEDRLIEDYEMLLNLTKRQKIYKNFSELCIKADAKYNSQLFYTEEYLKKLHIDDDILSDIIKGLYYPESPYEFSVMEVEILGNIYEQFLGKIIRLTPGHHAKIEAKPEVRKAGGVYYTPQYIVDYIVENTVGEKIKEKKPQEIESLTILDPACGSGSFLLGAYTFLMEYHLKYYTSNENINIALKDGKIYQISENNYKLTIEEKRKILLNNIYGVDIDNQAVEVTKLSLLLKLMENENQESIGKLFKYSDVKVLPDLSNNIKCGNSLIGTDFYANQDLGLFENKDMKKVNAFDWDKEFSEIFKNGGFDVVIGNPPYGAELQPVERDYLDLKFKLGNSDTACLFIKAATSHLKNDGINSFIIPKPFVYSSNWANIREVTLPFLKEIVDCGKVWKDVLLEQIIYFYDKCEITDKYHSCKRENDIISFLGDIEKETFKEFGFILNSIRIEELNLGRKVRHCGMFLNDVVNNQRGSIYQKYITEKVSYYKVLGGKQISKYYMSGDIKGYLPKNIINDEKAYIKKDSILVQRIVAHISNPFDHIMIIATIPNTIERNQFVIVDTINQLDNTSKYSSKYLLAIINSRLTSWYAYNFIFAKAIRTMQFDNPVTSRIPIFNLNLNNKFDFLKHNIIVDFVNQMLTTQKEFHSSKNEQEKEQLKKKIDIIDNKIDRLVYELYGLTEEEIKVVEGKQQL